MDLRTEFTGYKRQALERYYSGMNDMQKRAVFQTDGPLLILAGAGSGKTTVLINRIENMICFGGAYHSDRLPPFISEDGIALLTRYVDGGGLEAEQLAEIIADNPVRPWNILAITFTNKAAGELKARLASKLGSRGEDVHASTFHSLCVRILRREIQALDYKSSFTIYDTDDSLRVLKDVLKELNIDEKVLTPRVTLTAISRAKDTLATPEWMHADAAGDFRLENIARAYDLYQKRLKSSDALDFDDIIVNTVRIFQRFPDVLDRYQNLYKYIMVDEYQDTNHAQYLLVSMLAQKHGNICVVGDDDQSIYKFRGATIENILSFEEQFKDAAVIRLEQNYRSTQNILGAANGIIANNRERKGKNLWTSADGGDKVILMRVDDEVEESRFIADSILEHVKEGAAFSDHAVLYRMNAQSSPLEVGFAKNGIPYKIVGGVRFFDHKEIRDIVAYLNLIDNTSDGLRLLRIINEPKRGIGSATLSSVREIADGNGISMFEVIENAQDYPSIAKKAAPLRTFADIINGLIEIAETKPLDYLFDELLMCTGYMKMLESQGFEGVGRIENVLEFKSIIIKYMQESEEPELSGFLEEIALYTDLDGYDASADRVTLMTVHSAKGLEFRYVYIAGMDEGIFPGSMALYSDAAIEEERRLAYVAVTRAKELLTIVSSARRMLFGRTMYNQPSRFISEIPAGFVTKKQETRKVVESKKIVMKKTVSPSARTIGVGSGSASVGAGSVKGDKLKEGDRVTHRVFGEGTVLSAKPMASDMLLEVDFDSAGKKKIMANYAGLAKID